VGGGWDVDGADGFTSQTVVNFPGRAPVPVDQAHLALWGSPRCSGTVFAPDPQPGYVCVSQIGSAHKGTGDGPLVAASTFSAPDRGFMLELTNVTGDTAFYAQGVWAYRAP
jgi:hypothetical protein